MHWIFALYSNVLHCSFNPRIILLCSNSAINLMLQNIPLLQCLAFNFLHILIFCFEFQGNQNTEDDRTVFCILLKTFLQNFVFQCIAFYPRVWIEKRFCTICTIFCNTFKHIFLHYILIHSNTLLIALQSNSCQHIVLHYIPMQSIEKGENRGERVACSEELIHIKGDVGAAAFCIPSYC